MSSARLRLAALALLLLRIAYGVGLIAAPARLAKAWLGDAAESAPTRVPLRALGGREIAVHAAALHALARARPLRPWLTASIAGDMTDVLATAAGRRGLPERAASKTAAVAGGSALLTLALWRAAGER